MPGCEGTIATTSTATQCFPSAVALGGGFRVRFTPSTSMTLAGNPVLRPASPDYMAAIGDGQFKTLKTG
jgi:hypothetical protein